MLYVQLDTNWPDHPKIIRAGWEAAGAHAAIMCVAKRTEADGWVPRLLLNRMAITDDTLTRLIDLELLDAEGDRVRPHDWLDRNPSKAAIAARRDAKIRAGKKANHIRWEHPHPEDTCPICFPPAQADPGWDRSAPTSDSESIPEHPTPTSHSQREDPDPKSDPDPHPDATRLDEEQITTNLTAIAQLRQERLHPSTQETHTG